MLKRPAVLAFSLLFVCAAALFAVDAPSGAKIK